MILRTRRLWVATDEVVLIPMHKTSFLGFLFYSLVIIIIITIIIIIIIVIIIIILREKGVFTAFCNHLPFCFGLFSPLQMLNWFDHVVLFKLGWGWFLHWNLVEV